MFFRVLFIVFIVFTLLGSTSSGHLKNCRCLHFCVDFVFQSRLLDVDVRVLVVVLVCDSWQVTPRSFVLQLQHEYRGSALLIH